MSEMLKQIICLLSPFIGGTVIYILIRHWYDIIYFFRDVGKYRDSMDFSDIEINGYQYYKTAYARSKKKSALITSTHIDLIIRFNKYYIKRESLISKAVRLLIDSRINREELVNSFLFYVYSLGFAMGYQEIEWEIKSARKRKQQIAIERCNEMAFMTPSVTIKELSKEDSLQYYRKYFNLIGRKEGAKVRALLYEKEMNLDRNTKLSEKKQGKMIDKRCLSELLSHSSKDVNQLIANMRKILLTKNTDVYIAYLKIALEEEALIDKCPVTTFRNALESHYEDIEFVKKRGIQREYSRLNTVTNEGVFLKDIESERICIDGIKLILLK